MQIKFVLSCFILLSFFASGQELRCSKKTQKDILSAKQFMEQGQSEKAFDLVAKLENSNSFCFEKLECLAQIYFRNGDWENGILYIDSVISRSDSFPSYLKRKAYFYLEMAELGPNRRFIDGTTVDFPSSGKKMEKQTENWKEIHWKKSLELFQFYTQSDSLAWNEIHLQAVILRNLGRFSESTKLFEQLKSNPKFEDEALLSILANQQSLQNAEGIEECLQVLSEKYPYNLSFHEDLMNLYTNQEKIERIEKVNKKLIFYKFMPSFLEIPFTEVRAELISKLLAEKKYVNQIEIINQISDTKEQLAFCISILEREREFDYPVYLIAKNTLLQKGEFAFDLIQKAYSNTSGLNDKSLYYTILSQKLSKTNYLFLISQFPNLVSLTYQNDLPSSYFDDLMNFDSLVNLNYFIVEIKKQLPELESISKDELNSLQTLFFEKMTTFYTAAELKTALREANYSKTEKKVFNKLASKN